MNASSRVFSMIVILLAFAVVEVILTRKHPYTKESRLILGDKILAALTLLAIVQPVAIPGFGLRLLPWWLAGLGVPITLAGLFTYGAARSALGSHAASPAVPTAGYLDTGVYAVFRHPMYVSFLLLACAIGIYGASVFSLALIPLCFHVYFRQKARREDTLRVDHESVEAPS